MRKQRFPKGWDAARVARVLDHYEGQAEDEAVAEDEAGISGTSAVVRVPHKLLPAVRRLIAKQGATRARKKGTRKTTPRTQHAGKAPLRGVTSRVPAQRKRGPSR